MRCFGDGDPQMAAYHDEEWGRPVLGETALFERLCLEAMQSGLSWRIVLRRREGMREAFAGFEPEALARFGEADVERLLGDARVIRNRRKIEAVIGNARAMLQLREQGRPLDALVWSFRPEPAGAPQSWQEVPASTEASKALAKELKRAGFVFVGPTTAYATMQAAGLVNDHLAGCLVRASAYEEQRRAAPPRPAR